MEDPPSVTEVNALQDLVKVALGGADRKRLTAGSRTRTSSQTEELMKISKDGFELQSMISVMLQ